MNQKFSFISNYELNQQIRFEFKSNLKSNQGVAFMCSMPIATGVV